MDSLKVDQHLSLHQSEHFSAKFNQVTHPSTNRTCNLHTENFKSERLNPIGRQPIGCEGKGRQEEGRREQREMGQNTN